MSSRNWLPALCVAVLAGLALSQAYAADPYWVQPMTQVHASFQGTRGTIARFGDSITYSGAFFKPLQYNFTNATAEEQAALDWLHAYLLPACWTWQDDAVAYSNGNYSGTTSAWPLQIEQGPPASNITFWLNKLKPELAVIMWGTNDLGPLDVTTYTGNMRQVLQACKAHGTIPLLTAIPPRVGYDAKSAQFAQAMRDLALEQQVPLIDYNQEILTRRPGTTWQNTLISGDGVHPSYNGATAQDFAASSLNSNGYLLRNWCTLHALWDVRQYILQFDPPIKHHTVTVFDTAASDVPGPEPIRAFPIPAAANWYNTRLIYDNYAAGLVFSPGRSPGFYNYVNLPRTNSDVTIHGVNNSPASPLVINDSFQLYVTQEGSDTDPRRSNRFPYHVPRLARSHAVDYLAVEFDLAAPAVKFGVFLPASSNNWGDDPQYVLDDQNFLLQDRSVWVTIVDTSGASQQQYVSLKVGGAGTYCPFLAIEWDGTHRITKVSIIHDVAENTDRGVSFMDVYSAVRLAGDVDGDDHVDVLDLLWFVDAFGSMIGDANYDARCDFNGDGAVDVVDLLIMVDYFGT
jgi:lysophospholipase L1-like esterase